MSRDSDSYESSSSEDTEFVKLARSRDFAQKQLYYDDSSSSDEAEGEETMGGSPEQHERYHSSSSRDSFTNKVELYKSKGYHESSEDDDEEAEILQKNRQRKQALLKEMRGKKVQFAVRTSPGSIERQYNYDEYQSSDEEGEEDDTYHQDSGMLVVAPEQIKYSFHNTSEEDSHQVNDEAFKQQY